MQSFNGCYYVGTDEMTWSNANKFCISLHPNSHLVAINSDAKQTAVSELLNQQLGVYWLQQVAYSW